MQPSFCHALYYNAPGFSDLGGFIANETYDERSGGVGLYNYDVVNYQAFQVRAKMLGALLTNVVV
jgi:hypothetical protein